MRKAKSGFAFSVLNVGDNDGHNWLVSTSCCCVIKVHVWVMYRMFLNVVTPKKVPC